MNINEYHQQAEAFLVKHGIKFRATLSDSKPAPWADDGKYGHHYRVTLSKHGGKPDLVRNFGEPKRTNRLTFDFWGSIADHERLIDAEKDLQNIQLQIQNTEPHLRINLRDVLREREQAVNELHPVAYDVLACISGDTYCPETFEDFCNEYGYDTDSITALQTFRRVARFSKRLREFFTDEEIEGLQEIQ